MDLSDEDNAGLYRDPKWVAKIEDRGYFRVLSELSTRGFLQGLSSECESVTPILEGLTERWPTLARMSAQDRYAVLLNEVEKVANPKELAASTSWKYVLRDRVKTQYETGPEALRAATSLQRRIAEHNASFPPLPSPSPPQEKKPRNNNAKRKQTIDTLLEEYREEIRESLDDLTPQLQLRLLRSLVREYAKRKKE